jgi:hypothetical protein
MSSYLINSKREIHLEQLKKEKIAEAEELFSQVKIHFNQMPKDYNYYNDHLTNLPTLIKEPQESSSKLMWTRLSINSNVGITVD